MQNITKPDSWGDGQEVVIVGVVRDGLIVKMSMSRHLPGCKS